MKLNIRGHEIRGKLLSRLLFQKPATYGCLTVLLLILSTSGLPRATAAQATEAASSSLKVEEQPTGDIYVHPSNKEELYIAVQYPVPKGKGRTVFLDKKTYVLDRPLELSNNTSLQGSAGGTVILRNFGGTRPTISAVNTVREVGAVKGRMTWDNWDMDKNKYNDPGKSTYRLLAELKEELPLGRKVIIESGEKKNGYGLLSLNEYIGKDSTGRLMFEYLPSFRFGKGDVIRAAEDFSLTINNLTVDNLSGDAENVQGESGYRYTHDKFKKTVSSGPAIYVEGVLYGSLTNLYVKRHKTGVHLKNSHKVSLSGVTVERNHNGISIESSSLIDISNSRIMDSYETGIWIKGSYNVKFIGNTIESSALLQGGPGDTLTIHASTNVMVSKNTISRSGCYGIWVLYDSENILITNNIITAGITGACLLDSDNKGQVTKTNSVLVKNNIFVNNPWAYGSRGGAYDIRGEDNIVKNMNWGNAGTGKLSFYEKWKRKLKNVAKWIIGNENILDTDD